MLHNIRPQPKHSKSKDGTLNANEKTLVKGLLGLGYRAQDITFIINQGRKSTVNQARVSQVETDDKIDAASESEVQQYLRVQAAYDPKTLLNPYKDHRLIRAREAMTAAVQAFNNPTTIFKTELFCVLANIAWTYLLHEKMERTKTGSSKLDNEESVTLSGTLDKPISPIKDKAVIENLKKVTDIRIAVEHKFFVGGDQCFGALFQACCVNFENHMVEWFGEHLSLAKELSMALQFVRLGIEQVIELEKSYLPQEIRAISDEIQKSQYANNNAFQLTVYYSTEISSKTNADITKLVSYKEGNRHIIAVKKVDYARRTQGQIVEKIRKAGYTKFTDRKHQEFWMQKWKNATERNGKAGKYGELLLKNQWMWFEQIWFPEVPAYCASAGDKFQ